MMTAAGATANNCTSVQLLYNMVLVDTCSLLAPVGKFYLTKAARMEQYFHTMKGHIYTHAKCSPTDYSRLAHLPQLDIVSVGTIQLVLLTPTKDLLS